MNHQKVLNDFTAMFCSQSATGLDDCHELAAPESLSHTHLGQDTRREAEMMVLKQHGGYAIGGRTEKDSIR